MLTRRRSPCSTHPVTAVRERGDARVTRTMRERTQRQRLRWRPRRELQTSRDRLCSQSNGRVLRPATPPRGSVVAGTGTRRPHPHHRAQRPRAVGWRRPAATSRPRWHRDSSGRWHARPSSRKAMRRPPPPPKQSQTVGFGGCRGRHWHRAPPSWVWRPCQLGCRCLLVSPFPCWHYKYRPDGSTQSANQNI